MPEPRIKRTKRDRYTVDTSEVQSDGTTVMTLSKEIPVTSRHPVDRREDEAFAKLLVEAIPGLLAMPLNNNDLRVLLALVSDIGFDGPWRPYYKGLAETHGIPRPSWDQSLRRLKDNGIVFDLEARMILLNPTMFWRGEKTARWEWVHRLRAAGRLPASFAPDPEES